MGAQGVEIAASVFSNLFRLAAWVFLRVIPATHMKWIIPTLFSGYASCLFLSPPATTTPDVRVEVKREGKLNGTHTNGVKPESIVAVAQPASTINTLSSLLFSFPSPIKRTRLLNLAINVLLLNFIFDLYFTPLLDPATGVAFARVGAVGPDSVKLALRYPFPNATTGVVQVVYRQVQASELLSLDAGAWKDGPLVSVSAERDWTAVTKLSGLWPSTSYEYRLADLEKYLLPTPAKPVSFKTFPDPRLPTGNRFRFIVSSCQTPNFPYRPLAGRRMKGYDLLAEYLWPTPPPAVPVPEEVLMMEDVLTGMSAAPKAVEESTEGVDPTTAITSADAPSTTHHVEMETNTVPLSATDTDESFSELDVTPEPEAPSPAEFMLFLGDFVYADVPVWWGDTTEAYRRLYRRVYNSPSFRKVYEKLPMFNVYDDHEITNNYAGLGNDSHPYANASDAWTLYNGAANPDALTKGEHYFDFRYGDVAFFVMDSRRYRSDVFTTEVEERTMLGETQLAALYEWLGKVNQTTTFKFIVTSVPFTSLWTHDAQVDSWAGFAEEKNALLEALHTVPNVVILSGDRHEAAVIEFAPPSAGEHKLFEISTSPLSMFYVPLVRTLDQVSAETVQHVRRITTLDAEGNETVTEEVDEVPKERVLNYTPIGNYKWSAIEVNTRDLDHPVAKLELVADGKVAYKLEIAGTPVKLKSTTALGAIVNNRLTQFFSRIGFDPSRWF